MHVDETNNDTVKQNSVELGQKENKCVMNYRREYNTVSKEAKCPEKRQTKWLCPLKGFLSSEYNGGKGLLGVTLGIGEVVGGQTWWMWISSVNGTIGEGLDGGGVRGWHGGDMRSQGFLALVCVKSTAAFTTHAHKHILENFLPSSYSTSYVALSRKGEVVVKFIFPICHYGNQDLGIKKHNKSRNKNSIHIKISINHTCTYSRSTIAFFGYWKQEIDSMFDHQWLLNTDQIIKKARLYIHYFFDAVIINALSL